MSAPVSIEHKKGEVAELKASLRNPAVERDPEKRREVVKRVIAYMTLGIDVSRLFTEMIMATSSKDLVVKKMVYLYVTNYASTNPELSLLAINTLQKDCRDEDPMTRGLALRSFCGLRLPNIVEYLQKPLEDGLADPSAYVRRTAAMGCLRLHNLAPSLLLDSGLKQKLQLAMADRDTSVIASAICALEEMDGRKTPVEKKVVHLLLNRMREFNEWAQVVVLGLVARYQPIEPQETFDIMNLLEERLRHSNAAVVLATTKVFLNLTSDFPQVHQQVYTRLRTPLVTLVHGGSVEQGYVTLKHIALLAQRAPAVFAEEHKLFFARFNEPSYVKLVKLEILTAVATARNVAEIVEEVAEYVTDSDMAVSRAAVATIGRLGATVGSAAKAVADQLVALLSIGIPHVSAEAVVAMQTLLRKHPALLRADGDGGAPQLAHAIATFSRYALDEPEARCSLLWVLGAFGEMMAEAPYVLEPMIDEFNDEPSAAVRLELLSACVKLLLKRPGEMQAMTGRLLEAAVADTRFTEVHDRAMFYYRLLQHDVGAAQRVLLGGSEARGGALVDENSAEWQDKLFEEFNSLAVIYGLPSDRFIKPNLSASAASREQLATLHGEAEADVAAAARAAASAEAARQAYATNQEEEEGEEESEEESDEEEEEGAPPLPAATGSGNGLGNGLLDLLGDLTMPSAPVAPAAPSPLALAAGFNLDSATFQAQWGAIGESCAFALPFASSPAAQPVVTALGAHAVKCMAFGTVGAAHKFYFYAQQEGGPVFLVELVLDLGTHAAKGTVKSTSAAALPRFVEHLKALVRAAVP